MTYLWAVPSYALIHSVSQTILSFDVFRLDKNNFFRIKNILDSALVSQLIKFCQLKNFTKKPLQKSLRHMSGKCEFCSCIFLDRQICLICAWMIRNYYYVLKFGANRLPLGLNSCSRLIPVIYCTFLRNYRVCGSSAIVMNLIHTWLTFCTDSACSFKFFTLQGPKEAILYTKRLHLQNLFNDLR